MANDIYGTPEHVAFRESVRRFVERAAPARTRVRRWGASAAPHGRMGEPGMLGLR
jgi:hypothetical protein